MQQITEFWTSLYYKDDLLAWPLSQFTRRSVIARLIKKTFSPNFRPPQMVCFIPSKVFFKCHFIFHSASVPHKTSFKCFSSWIWILDIFSLAIPSQLVIVSNTSLLLAACSCSCPCCCCCSKLDKNQFSKILRDNFLVQHLHHLPLYRIRNKFLWNHKILFQRSRIRSPFQKIPKPKPSSFNAVRWKSLTHLLDCRYSYETAKLPLCFEIGLSSCLFVSTI